MAEKPTADRAASSDVTISLGFASVLGDLHTIPVANAGKTESLSSVCPACDEPHEFMGAALVCKEDKAHGPFVKSQIKMGKMIGDKIVIVDPNTVKTARESVLPEKSLALQVHKREDVEANTFPMGNAYVFTPKGSSPFYAILVELLRKRRDVCFIAKTNLRKQDHLVMLDLEMNGQLVIRELIWPEDMKEFKAVKPVEITDVQRKKLTAQAETLLDVSIEPFDRDEYKKDSRERVAAAIDEAASGKVADPAKVAKKVVKDDVDDLEAMIAAAIAAKKVA